MPGLCRSEHFGGTLVCVPKLLLELLLLLHQLRDLLLLLQQLQLLHRKLMQHCVRQAFHRTENAALLVLVQASNIEGQVDSWRDA